MPFSANKPERRSSLTKHNGKTNAETSLGTVLLSNSVCGSLSMSNNASLRCVCVCVCVCGGGFRFEKKINVHTWASLAAQE